MKHFIGVDLGTQSLKGMLFNPGGEMVAQASVQYIPDFPQPNWAEIDASVWVEALKDVIAQMKEESGVSAAEIGSLSFASLCGNVLPIGKNGHPLRKCILWLDRRSETQCEKVMEMIGEEEACQLIGSPITSGLPALKMMWIKENEPEIFNNTYKFLEPGEYLVYFLTGEFAADYANASVSGLYDVANREWSEKMCRMVGVPMGSLPPVRPASDIAGEIHASIAALIGLDPATKVVVGTGDQHSATIGSGLVGTGDVLNIMGTAEIIAGAADHVVYDKSRILKTHLHVDPLLWQIEQGALLSGGAVRWYRDNIARMSFDEMNAHASQATAGSKGLIFLPALSGSTSPELNGHARGIFFGMTMSHTFAEITRSVYEGCAYGFRDSIESLDAMGMGSGDIIAGGGGVNSAVWMQLKADMIGKVIRTLKTSDSTPLGAAMLAGVAQKNFANFGEAVTCLVDYGESYEPNLANKGIYDEMYGLYRDLYTNACPLFERYKTLTQK